MTRRLPAYYPSRDMRIEPVLNVSPEAAFIALKKLGRAFLFSGSRATGKRHSFAGAGPLLALDAAQGADPFESMANALSGPNEKGPFPFNSGVVGYLSYDLKDMTEPSKIFKDKSGLGIPPFMAGVYEPVFVYDHQDKKGFLVSAHASQERVDDFLRILQGAAPFKAAAIGKAEGFSSDVSRDDYISAVVKAKEYIAAGDIYQINVSHRLSIKWQGDPFSLYMKLLETHPAPMSSYMDFGDFQVISNSPERLLRINDGVAETSPIKGTRPRGKMKSEDQELIEELRASRKERAEHVMIVDLERNDLGKVSLAGTVEVSAFEEVETYPHLHHMVSTIRGTLKPGMNPALALKALFPGGSITGAPKVRAMEIIDELEMSARSIYTGSIGWFDFAGDAEASIAIRTAVYKDGILYLNVGAGIVADSDPESEYEETMLKAQDFLKVLGVDR